jgi:8-oxo-dGTP diphosphatase
VASNGSPLMHVCSGVDTRVRGIASTTASHLGSVTTSVRLDRAAMVIPNTILARQRPFLAVYCIILRDQRLLLMKRINTGYADGQWSVPAGHVDEGEAAAEAATRELAEETALNVNPDDWRLHAVMHRRTIDRTIIDVFFRVNLLDGEPRNLEPTRCAELRFFPLTGLPELFVPYVRMALRAEVLAQGSPDIGYFQEGWL